ALFINGAILVLAASAFHWSGHQNVAEIQDAYKLLSPLLGVSFASVLFAVALLASGQNSTLTGTLAGQIVMEGFLNFRITPWVRRLLTRLIAIVPAVVVIAVFGEGKTTQLLVASQVVLSMQLGFAVWPLMRFTGEKAKMGQFMNPLWIKILGWTTTLVIIVLNIKLLFDTFMPDSVLKAFYNVLGLPVRVIARHVSQNPRRTRHDAVGSGTHPDHRPARRFAEKRTPPPARSRRLG